MDWGLFWTIAGVIVAIATGYFAIYGYFRDHPKRRLEYSVSIQRLIPNQAAARYLEVRANGLVVRDPHMMIVQLASNSRANIPSDEFDQGRPLQVNFQVPAIVVAKSSTGDRIPVSGWGTDGLTSSYVGIGPELIHPKDVASFAVITAGKPAFTLPQSLKTVPIRMKREARTRTRISQFGHVIYRYYLVPLVYLFWICALAILAWNLVAWVANWFTGN